MIDHRGTRLALRKHLLTLSVCTTGSTTLAATATGYSRAAGSFLDDGFAVGMEVTPDGFTQESTGVITGLTALTMEILGGRTAEASGSGRTLSVGLPESRAWENVDHEPTAGVPYVQEDYAPGAARQVGLDPASETEVRITYAPKIHVPEDTGPGAADAYADAILALFPPGLGLSVDEGTLRVTGRPAPWRGQAVRSKPGFVTVPVNIPLMIRSVMAIV